MSQTTATTLAPPPDRTGRARPLARWLVSFAGFPLGGLAATLAVGPVDSLATALTGGLLTGTVLGVVQAWALGPRRPWPAAWVVATAVGLGAGLAGGSAVVDFRTDLGSLVVQGLVSGATVGLAQAVVLMPRLGAAAAIWPLWLAGCWAAGWTVTTVAGVDVESRYTVFGAFGAVTVTCLTGVLPYLLHRRASTS